MNQNARRPLPHSELNIVPRVSSGHLEGVMFCAFLAALLAAAPPARADTCRDAFIKAWTASKPTVPVKIHVTQKVGNQKPTTNYNFTDPAGNWLTQMIDPPNAPWSMVRGKMMYVSTDQGKSWKKVRETDDAQSPEARRKYIEDAMTTVQGAVCGTEDLGGVRHATVAADYAPQAGFAVREKFWLHPDTGRVSKSTSKNTFAGVQSETIQVIEYLQDYVFPNVD